MRALLLVDIQNDFLPGGALPVPDGHQVINVANLAIGTTDYVVATQDWHPSDHRSFASQHSNLRIGETFLLNGSPQVAWPDHCVQGTLGADLAAALAVDKIDHVSRKGTNRLIDSYSGFFDNDRLLGTGLDDHLRSRGIDELVVMGLATDYCVKYTVLDALALGYRTRVLLPGCRGIDMQPGDVVAAIETMRDAGAEIMPDAVG